MTINTHGLTVDFGKHKGEAWTRVPVDYLKWLANQPPDNSIGPESEERKRIARAELKRRNLSPAELAQTELSEHAIDRAVETCFSVFRVDRRSGEGFCAWLRRVADEAHDHGERGRSDDERLHKQMRFILKPGELHRTLVTVMRSSKAPTAIE